ncbi:MAG: sensor histidine kinase, partial [Nitrospiria bacterium]
IDTAIPCGLIINELVSNALKHAFPAGREGEIRIELHSDDSQMHLTVSDNGIGFPKDLDLRNPKSLGLQLVNRLTDQLKGTLKSERNGGSAWKMTFPRPQKR